MQCIIGYFQFISMNTSGQYGPQIKEIANKKTHRQTHIQKQRNAKVV